MIGVQYYDELYKHKVLDLTLFQNGYLASGFGSKLYKATF